MKHHFKYLVSALLVNLAVSGSSLAAPAPKADLKQEDNERNPIGCKDVGYEYDLKVLRFLPEAAGERNSLYFVYNSNTKPVNLYQMRNQESTHSMYLNHTVKPKQWSVLSTSERQLKYICTVDDGKSQYGKIVDCADSVRVCEFARVAFGLNNRGNFWLVSSNTRNGAVNEVVRYGIIPR